MYHFSSIFQYHNMHYIIAHPCWSVCSVSGMSRSMSRPHTRVTANQVSCKTDERMRAVRVLSTAHAFLHFSLTWYLGIDMIYGWLAPPSVAWPCSSLESQSVQQTRTQSRCWHDMSFLFLGEPVTSVRCRRLCYENITKVIWDHLVPYDRPLSADTINMVD